MTADQLLVGALQHYGIPIISIRQNKVYLPKDYVIEVEATGVYKLLQHEEVIGPFDDLDELSLFVLRY